MGSKKDLIIANFNCTYGENDDPMLKYFENILYPAFKSGFQRSSDGNDYFFDYVRVIEYEKDEFLLTGLIIKKTIIEINSTYEDGQGLKLTNEKYPSAPYSFFVIFLKNHRMAFVKNQKGSPTIGNFNATCNYVVNKYINQLNRNKEDKDKLPFANINIVSIPAESAIKNQLKSVFRIKKLTLRLYPLNGDVPVSGLFRELRQEMGELGSKSSNYVVNSPKNIENVATFIDHTKGTADPILDVVFSNGDEKTLRSNSFTERIPVSIDGTQEFTINAKHIADHIKDRDEIKDVSEENKVIYLTHVRQIRGKLEESRYGSSKSGEVD